MLLLVALFSLALAQENAQFAYIAIGNASRTSLDYLATIDYTYGSPTYGKVIDRDYLDITISPNILTAGNDIHHISLGGYPITTHVIVGARAPGTKKPQKDQLFVFSLDPETHLPSYAYSLAFTFGACLDEMVPVNDAKTQFIVTMMCSVDGATPGVLGWFDILTREVKQWSPVTPPTNFNPHSGDYHPEIGFFAANFINPVVATPRVYRDTLDIFNLNGSHNKTLTPPGSGQVWFGSNIGNGFMDVKWIDDTGRAVTCASLQGVLFLLQPFNAPAPEVVQALDLVNLVNGGVRTFSGTSIKINNDRNRLVATYALRYLILVGWDSNYQFSLLDVWDSCAANLGFDCTPGAATIPYSGLHYVRIAPDESHILVAASYTGFNSIRRVFSFTVNAAWNKLTLEPGFNPDVWFDGAPHGTAIASFDPPAPPEPCEELPPICSLTSGFPCITNAAGSLPISFILVIASILMIVL